MGRQNQNQLPHYLRKDKNGYFLDYSVKVEGRPKRIRERLPNCTKLQALNRCAEKTAQLEAMKRHGHNPYLTFSEAAKDLLVHKLLRKKTGKSDQAALNYFKGILGEIRVSQMTHNDVDEVVSQLMIKGPKGKPLKNSSINRYLAPMKACTRFAFLNGKLTRDPLAGYRMLREKNERNRVLTTPEYQSLVEASPDHLRPVVYTAYRVAMRRGELLGLEWDQVDLKAGKIRLDAEDTKTGEYREVPLDRELVRMFECLPRCPGSKRVFLYWKPSKDGSIPTTLVPGPRVEMKDIKTAFNRAVIKAGLEDFHFHDLRHCAITNMRRAGVDLVTIMAITGHRSTQVFKRYNTVDIRDKQAALAAVTEQELAA